MFIFRRNFQNFKEIITYILSPKYDIVTEILHNFQSNKVVLLKKMLHILENTIINSIQNKNEFIFIKISCRKKDYMKGHSFWKWKESVILIWSFPIYAYIKNIRNKWLFYAIPILWSRKRMFFFSIRRARVTSRCHSFHFLFHNKYVHFSGMLAYIITFSLLMIQYFPFTMQFYYFLSLDVNFLEYF